MLEDPELELVGGYTRTRKSNIDYTSFLEVPKVDVLIDFPYLLYLKVFLIMQL